MVRFRHSSVSGLPVRALAAAYLALHLTPPSSNRTCGFPASGSPVSSRLGLSQVSQIHQSHFLQMTVQRGSFRGSVRSLTASLKMTGQAVSHIAVGFPKCIARVSEGKVVRPALKMLIQLCHQCRQRLEAHLLARHSAQLFALSFQGFLGGDHIKILLFATVSIFLVLERVSQKVQAGSFFSQVDYSGFLPVKFQFHPSIQFRFYVLHQFLSLIACHHHEIIRISHQSGLRPLCRSVREMENFVEPVQIDIRQKRRYYATLRRSLFGLATGRLSSPSFLFCHRAFQPHAD